MHTSSSSQTLKQKAYQQFKKFLVIALYLWGVFGLLELHKSMILAEHHIDFFVYHGCALIMCCGSVRTLRIARAMPRKATLYSSVGNAALLALCPATFHFHGLAGVSYLLTNQGLHLKGGLPTIAWIVFRQSR